MAPDNFNVTCDSCGHTVAIRSVSEFHIAGGFCGYSYTVHCECGAATHHDGVDGDFIPESMKRAASVRHRAFAVLGTIDFQRRALPASSGKRRLHDARLKIPELLADNSWRVYQLSEVKTVSYSPDNGIYVVRDGEFVQRFSAVIELAKDLDSDSESPENSIQ